jgi:hypothetical protein
MVIRCTLFTSMVDVAPWVRLLAPATGDPVLRLDFDWTARVTEVAPHLLARAVAYLIGKPGQRLACGTAAAFKGAVIGVE